MALNDYQKGFLASIKQAAEEICPEFDIPPQVCVAQAVLESGWGGMKRKSAKGKTFEQFGEATSWNLFGIKGAGDAGSQDWTTREYLGTKPTGHYVTIVAAFAKYSSLNAAVRAYSTLLSNKRYRVAREHFSQDPGRYITYVWASGYATAPNYPRVILSLIKTIAAAGFVEYQLETDPALEKVITQLQGVKFGKDRVKIRNSTMRNLFGSSEETVLNMSDEDFPFLPPVA